jgi:hypothetical protein
VPVSPQRTRIRLGSSNLRAVKVSRESRRSSTVLRNLPLAHWYALWAYASLVVCSTCQGPYVSFPSAQYLTLSVLAGNHENRIKYLHCTVLHGHFSYGDSHSTCFRYHCSIPPRPLLEGLKYNRLWTLIEHRTFVKGPYGSTLD